MRYLKQREDFIKNNNFSNYSLIKEDSGPLANEIPWGDSLLGRLINSVIRKAEIGMNLVRIDSVIDRLKGEFDKLIADSVVKTLDKKDAILIFKIKISTLLGKLKEAVDKGEDVEIIKSITKDLIKDVESYKATSPEGEEAKKDLLAKLNEFLKDLDKKPEDIKDKNNILPKMMENFTSVYNILCQYDKIKKETGSVKKNLGEKEKETKGLTGSMATTAVKDKDLKKDSYSWSINEQEDVKSLTFDPKLSSVIKPLYGFFVQTGRLTFDGTEFNKLLGSDKGYKNQYRERGLSIQKIYNVIRGLFKLPNIETKANESVDDILGRTDDTGKLIFNLYNVTKTKESSNFDGIGEVMTSEIAKFNSTMKEILSFKSEVKENVPTEPNVEPKAESMIYRYSQFIKEAEETPVSKEEPSKEPKAGESVREIFYRIFSTDYLDKWVITEETAKRLEIEMDKANTLKSITINGIDPIIEIVKIFNRAWKLHTVPVIPSGRTGEKVSSRTKRDYYYMGTGNEPTGAAAGGAGPWRVRTIYDKWESAVQDIIKDSKYQVIFNKDTTIKVGEADTRVNVDKEGKEGGGRALLKFINSMLDGDDLYKKGSQAAFINQYFGIQVKDESLGYTGDKKEIEKTTGDLKPTTKYSFKKVESLPDGTLLKEDNVGRRFFSVKYNDGSHKTRYFFIDKREGDHIFVKFSPSFYQFKQYLKKIGSIDLPKDIVVLEKDTNNKDLPIYYGKILMSDLPIKGGKVLKISSFNISNYNKFKVAKKETGEVKEPTREEITITGIDEVSILVDSNDTVVRLDDNIVTKGNGLDGTDRDVYKDKLK